MEYLRLTESSRLPNLGKLRPFKAIVIAEERLSSARLSQVSDWLAQSGCLYAMACGDDCGAWYEAIQLANRKAHSTELIPDASLIITTAHADESLQDVFWFAKHTAMHPCHELQHTVLIDVAAKPRKAELLAAYAMI
jgi:hypothetical protein